MLSFIVKASLNHYKGFSSDECCTQLEKMILVSLCSRIMNVSMINALQLTSSFWLMFAAGLLYILQHMVVRNLLTTML